MKIVGEMYLFYKNTNKQFNGNGWMCVINHYEDFDEYFNQQYLIENGRGLKSKAANCCMFFVWVLFLKVIYCIFLHITLKRQYLLLFLPKLS